PELGELRAGALRRSGDRDSRLAAHAIDPGARSQLRSSWLRAHHRRNARADAPAADCIGGAAVKPLLIFDMDGVLVEVSESYRETIAQTVEKFTGVKPTREQIQELKNAGGFNDDWRLTHRMITESGIAAEFDAVRDYFQSIFLGGLMQRERWVARP